MNIIFQTERLIIRNWIPQADAPQAFEVYSDPDVTRFIGGRIENIAQTQPWLEGIVEYNNKRHQTSGFWALVEKATESVIGAIMLKQLPDKEGKPTEDYEVGWHLRQASWGKGYATEAARGTIEYGFKTIKLPIIYAVVHPENYPSIRVTQRLGMIPKGLTNKYYGVEEVELFEILPSLYGIDQ
jgi:[ribosomal protein S5]-alanine N-acetyltransferase